MEEADKNNEKEKDIEDLTKENYINTKKEDIPNIKEEENNYDDKFIINNNFNFEQEKNNLNYLKNNYSEYKLNRSNIINNYKKTKRINDKKPNLNYDYGDNVNTEILKELSNNKINDNFGLNTFKSKNIINIKNYSSLYNEYKYKFNKNNNDNNFLENRFKNYFDTNINGNYFTLNPYENLSLNNNMSNNTTYNFSLTSKYDNNIKEVSSPIRTTEFIKNNNNKSFDYLTELNDYNKNNFKAFTPNRYYNFNNNVDKSNNNNLIHIISNFFNFISKNYIQNLYLEKNILNEEDIILNFKKIEEYIIKLNKEVNDYKYKYQKLLDIDSIRPTMTTKNSVNIYKDNSDNKKQNSTISDIYDNINNNFHNKNFENILKENIKEHNNNYSSLNSYEDNDIYKALEKRVFILEKELLSRKNEKGEKKGKILRAKSGNKILFDNKFRKENNKEMSMNVENDFTEKNDKKIKKNRNNYFRMNLKEKIMFKNRNNKSGKFKKKS